MSDALDAPNLDLMGAGVVITRSKEQAANFALLVKNAGGRAILFPVIEIEETCHREQLMAGLHALKNFNIAIFVSTNAVKHVLPLLSNGLPKNLQIATIGQSTKSELARAGVLDIIAPTLGADSEFLLELSEMTRVAGKRIAIFRGNGGRDVLRDTLTDRGAFVQYVECYRRIKPSTNDVSVLLKAWRTGGISAITINSVEGLHNLVDIVGESGKVHLKKTPLFVPHERVAAEARTLQFSDIIVTGVGDEKMLQALARRIKYCARLEV